MPSRLLDEKLRTADVITLYTIVRTCISLLLYVCLDGDEVNKLNAVLLCLCVPTHRLYINENDTLEMRMGRPVYLLGKLRYAHRCNEDKKTHREDNMSGPR